MGRHRGAMPLSPYGSLRKTFWDLWLNMIKDSHTRLIAAQIQKSELQIIPGNHFIANKESEMFNEVVLRFLVG